MATISSYPFTIQPENVDFTLRASAASIISYMLNVAGTDAHLKGFGVEALQGHSFTWVLSRLAVEISTQPRQYTDIEIDTWVNEFNRLSSTRNFTLTDDSGREFGRAVSQWCMIDYATRMPVDMNTMAKAHEGNMVDAPSPCERPRRIGVVTSEPVVEHRVVYSDIDFNRHMNTMRYIDIIIDSMPIEVPEKLVGFRLDMNFMKEARYGDSLVLMAEERDGARMFEYRNEAGDALCRMALEIK